MNQRRRNVKMTMSLSVPHILLSLLFIVSVPYLLCFTEKKIKLKRINWCLDARCKRYNHSGTSRLVDNIACGCRRRPGRREIFKDLVLFRRQMMHLHNTWRDHLAAGKLKQEEGAAVFPKASNMRAVSYDLDLEYTARCWSVAFDEANKAPCFTIPQFEDAAQNIFVSGDDDYSYQYAIEQWWKEHKNFSPADVDKTKEIDDEVASFTHMAWSETAYVGCARTKISKLGNSSKDQFLLVCHYAPPSFVLQPLYNKGEPCSDCGFLDCNDEFKHLCGSITPIPTNLPIRIYDQGEKGKDFGDFEYEDISKSEKLTRMCPVMIVLLLIFSIINKV